MDVTIEGTEDVRDLHYHGTMVAGVIAAKCHNTLGIAGISKTAKLVSIRAADANGNSNAYTIAAAIRYATQAEIPILNISLCVYGSDELSQAIADYDGLIICAAGNYNQNTDTSASTEKKYPAAYSHANIISVGSSTSTDARASSSNYGATTVDLFAPGDGILSCYPLEECPVDEDGDSECTGGVEHYSTGYHFISGTSFAAPHVAGVAALIWTQYPNLTAAQVKARILEYVDPVSAFSGKCVTGGRLNAYKAVHSHHYAYDGGGHTQLQHNLNCTVCDHPTTTNHSYSVTSQTASGHVATCYTCCRTESGSHVYANNGAYCMICQYINPNGGIEIMGGQGENLTE